jgi:hypothetical protein
MTSIRAWLVRSLLTGLAVAACGASDSRTEPVDETDPGGTKNDHQDEILTRIMEREDGTVRVVMKRFRDEGLHDAAEDVMVGKKEFGRVSLDEFIVDTDRDMYTEQSATLLSDNSDVTNQDHIYIRVSFTDEVTGTAEGTVMGQRGKGEPDEFIPLDFVFESLCDTYLVDEGVLVTMKEFTDPELHDSAEDLMVGKKEFGDVHLDEFILNVRKRMFRETKAILVKDGSEITDRDNLYLTVEYSDGESGTARGTVRGQRDKDDRDEFNAHAFVFKGECMASGQ